MAAPIVSTSKQQATLKRLVKKEKSGKVVRKNLLCTEIQEWPRPSNQVQDEILTRLSEKLISLPNIFNKTVKEQKEIKAKARICGGTVTWVLNPGLCIVLVTQSPCMPWPQKLVNAASPALWINLVFRDLEKDKLDCVLVSGQATPAITVNHVITLCQERGCPVLCLDQLAVSLAKSTDSNCFPLAVGFKKMSESDFTEVVSFVKANAPVSAVRSGSSTNDNVVMSLTRPAHRNLIKLSRPDEEIILAELKRVFTQIIVPSAVKHEVKTKAKKKPKKKFNLKIAFDKDYHSLFDFGKRTVCEMVARDKVQLVLVSEEITPVLLGEPQSSSLLYSGSEKRCPIVMVTGLTSTLRPLCSGCVSVVGIKKCPSEGKPFQSLVDVCLDVLSQINPGTGPNVTATPDRPMVTQTRGGNDETASLDEVEGDYSGLYVLKKDSKEYLEAMAKLKEEMEKTQQDQKFTSDFISLADPSADWTWKSGMVTSAKPKGDSKPVKTQRPSAVCQALEPPATSGPRGNCEGSMVQDEGSANAPGDAGHTKFADPHNATTGGAHQDRTQNFTLSRAGDSNLLHKHKLTPGPATPTIQTPVKDGEELGPRQPAVTNNKATAGIDYLALSESGAKKSKKKHLKRKSETDGYLSFAYKGANIKTMTSNPNKRKKK